ncbi:UPF0179 family protein [Halocatena pleomorpha]|uniref:UPF0179 protein EIK79_13855 n=1 Tax=Halocatena pleomorpha TaxID=1785090 RepID=A0A3P3R705_9EURY|nr:UPF0179 family protein [Halocatena pleomorpha]RRJ29216.1 UPF0179 family protein [Halocatena pleomorpha]
MTSVTLIGTRLAEEGTEFVYQGESPDCEGCPYRDQCLNLTEGVRYQVTNVRKSGTLECAVHDTGVTAVDVEPTSVRAAVPSTGAYAGSTARLEGPCPHTDCPSHPYCEPVGAEFDTSYTIREVIGDPPHDFCMLDRDLTLAELEPNESE